MNKQYLFLLFFFLGSALFAQENLIPNGGFERYSRGKPVGWSFHQHLAFERSREAHSGKYAAKVWGNDGSFSVTNNQYASNVIDVEGNTEYKFSFWYKGTLEKPNLLVTISWYKDNTLIKREYMDDDKVTVTEEWQEKQLTIKSSIGVNKAGVSFRVYRGGGYAIIDDVSMVFSKKGEDKLPMPTGLVAKSYQREIELFWDKEADEDVKWEVVVNDQEPKFANRNSFIIDNLELNTQYFIKIRAVKGSATSEYTSIIDPTTQELNHSVESIRRVPHLRTLKEDSYISQTIDLYYLDLANKNADIKYFIDGVKTVPNNNKLTFPKKGEQKLKVIINEGDDKEWEIDYKITVR